MSINEIENKFFVWWPGCRLEFTCKLSIAEIRQLFNNPYTLFKGESGCG